MRFEKSFQFSFGSDVEVSKTEWSKFSTQESEGQLGNLQRCGKPRILGCGLLFILTVCVLAVGLSGCGSNYTVTAATGIGPFQASTDTVEFGNVAIGQAAISSLTLVNQGSTAISVTDLSITGNDFAVTSPTSLPITVAANSSYSVGMQFTPKASGDSTGQLTVTSNSKSSPSLEVKLDGNGASPSNSSGPALSSLTCGQNAFSTSGSDTCTVTLTTTATTGGLTVDLVSSNSAVTVPASVTVPAGSANAAFTVTVAAVTAAQSVTLTASASGSTQSYTLTLGATIAAMQLSTTSLNFGSLTVDTSSAAQTVTLTSSGSAPLTINSAVLNGAGFIVSGASFPATLNPGQSAILSVIFDPTVTGAINATINISDSTSSGPVTISLSGTGLAAAGSPAAVTLSALICSQSTYTGSGSDSCTASLSGAAGTGGEAVSLSSDNGAVAVPGSVTVPAGASNVGFTATVTSVTSAQTATLTASAGGATQTYNIALGAYVPGLQLSTASLNFGSETVNTSSPAQSVTLTSSGTAPLTINSAVLSGAGFSLSGANFPATLNPGQTATLKVIFDPSVTGNANGSISISDNSSPGTASISLSGTGQAAAGALSALSCSQNSFTGSGSDACTVSLSAVAGAGGLTVSLMSSNSAVTVPGSVTVPAGSSSVGFTATASAVTTAQTDTLTASAGGVNKTYGISLAAYVPGLQISTSSLNFGGVTVNTSSAAQLVTLTSSGAAPLTINSAPLAGAAFSMSGASFPVTLNPGQTATLTVTFDPTVTGAASGSITVSDNATPGTATISLSGTGQATAGVLSGLSCNQGSITGAGSDACTVSLSAGAAPGGLTVSLASSNSAVTVPGSVTVPAGSSSVGFTATVSAVTTAQTDTLTASAGGASKTYGISLGAAVPALTLGATSISFGDVDLSTPATQSVTLTNSGTATLTVNAGSASGTGFSIPGVSFPLTLNPGQTATLNVQFDPTTAGAATGTVTLTSNASPSTATISLSGTGQAVSYQVDLTWNAPSSSTDPVAGYNVYRATGSSSSYQLLNPSANVPTNYTDTSVQNSTSYTYYVESVDAQGNQSAPSNTYAVNIP
jgi:hypothetical protein